MENILSIEEIKNYFDALGFPYEHYSDGHVSIWRFDSDENGRTLRIRTGDGGAQLMVEALEQSIRNVLNDFYEKL